MPIPGNDATDIAETLKSLGFTVILLKDADQRSMEQGIVKFGNALSTSQSAVGFFFYAGHGVQANGINYLIPANAEIPGEAFLNTKAVAVQAVLDTLQQAGNKLNVIVLDACRDNPFSWSRSGTRGLTVVSAQPPGSIIAYATSAGSVAQDGTGRNGIFTTQLLRNLKKPDVNIFDMFLQTGADVKAATNGAQIPAIYSQYFEKYFLARAESPVPAAAEKLDGAHLDTYVAFFAKAREAEAKEAWGDALNAYASALTAIPGSESAAFGLAKAYWKLGNTRKANAIFQDMLERDAVPDYWDYGEIADFYFFAMRDTDTAIQLYTKALSCTEIWNLGWPLHGRGLAYRAKGDVENARSDLQKALAIGESLRNSDLVSECRKDLATLGR